MNASTMQRTPASPEEVTHEWMHSAVGLDRGQALTVSRIGDGQGFLGSVGRVAAETVIRTDTLALQDCNKQWSSFSGVPAVTSFIVKFPPSHTGEPEKSMFVNGDLRLHWNECHFYRVAEEALSHLGFIPKCFASLCDEDTLGGMLLLEDLGSGAGVPSFGAGMTVDQARAAVQALGQLHGSAWDRNDCLAVTYNTGAIEAAMPGMISEGIKALEQLATGRDRLARLLEQASVSVDELAGLQRQVGGAGAQKILTLCHGDLWSSNLLFSDAGAGNELQGIIDFQCAHPGHGEGDVAFMVMSSMLLPSGSRELDDMLQAYHQALTAALPEGLQYDFDTCRQRYHAQVPAACVQCLASADIYVDCVQRNPASTDALVARLENIIKCALEGLQNSESL